jgi:hypothetical protein
LRQTLGTCEAFTPMNRRPLTLALALAGTLLACGPKKQTPVDTADTAVTAEPPPPPPPPPPKCESLDEKCKAKGGKKAKIAGSLLVFEPVAGWIYAQTEKLTIAQAGDEDACLGIVGHDAPDAKEAKKVEQARQAQLEAVAAELKLTLPKTKVSWKSGEKYEIGQLTVFRWALEKVSRGEKKGDLLIVASQPADGKAFLGVGFVPGDDDKSAEKIVASFDTLAPGDAK